VIRVRKLNGVGQLKNPNSATGAMLPVLIGGGVTALTTLGIRTMVEPTDDTNIMIRDNAPIIGVAVGGLAGLALWNMASQPAGVATIAAAGVVGLSLWALEYAAMAKAQAAANAAPATAGIGAVVPEYSMPQRGNGVGAIVMEPQSSRGYGAGPLGRLSSYGETVNVAGLGAVNAGAFGTPGFSLGYGGGGYGSRGRY
jgi:hypothetical protein